MVSVYYQAYIASSIFYCSIDERTGLMAALILMAIGFFVIIPMGNDYPKIGISGIANCRVFFHYNNVLFHLVINPPIGANMTENPHTMSLIGNATYPVGCRMSKLSWCTEVPQMYMFQYIIGVIFFVLGYPASFVLCFTIYSKVLGRRSQVYITIKQLVYVYIYIYII